MAELRTRSEFQNRTVTLGVPYTLKFEIVRYGEREYGRTDVRLVANVFGERFFNAPNFRRQFLGNGLSDLN